ncbi:MAG: putative PEP-binding protein [Candidatus Woesearchaeota archaeon]
MINIQTMTEEALANLVYPRFWKKPTGDYVGSQVLMPFQVSGKVVTTTQELSRIKNERAVLVSNQLDPMIFDDPSKLAGIVSSNIPAHYKIVSSAEGIAVAVVESSEMDVITASQYASIDGLSGRIYLAQVATQFPDLKSIVVREVIQACKKAAKITVRVNADTVSQAKTARLLGAEGTGPVRTEYMFFQTERLRQFRKMLLGRASDEILASLRGFQVSDFEGILTAMDGYKVCIRLLDPPLHEFFPKSMEKGSPNLVALARELEVNQTTLEDTIFAMQESNPMLGWRGSRVGITKPEIYMIQVEAAILAVVNCLARGVDAQLEILVPLVMNGNEMQRQYQQIQRTVEATLQALKIDLKGIYTIGAMIEVPEACFDSASIAKSCQTFSFGTNDLTQCTYGVSRDDAKFIPTYIRQGILQSDPFSVIRDDGVGKLITMSIKAGRIVNPSLVVGVCGEQASSRESIRYLLSTGDIDYIAVSPFKVPITLLRVAQESLR